MNKKIKILFTIPNFDTAGSGKVVYDLVNGLDKALFAPEICCFHNRGAYFNTIKTLNVPIHIFPFATAYKPYLTLPRRIYNTYKFFKHHDFDIIHSWHWSSDISEPLAARFSKIPFVYTKKSMSWGNRTWNWRSKLSNVIIAINQDMVSQFFLNYKSKTIYIPLGVDTNIFKPLQKEWTIPQGLTIANDDFVIVTVANLVPIKGVEILLEAVNKLKDKSIKVLIVGDTATSYAQDLKVKYESENMQFLGKQSDIRPYLAVADTFVIPTKSKGEGLPVALLEAMASERVSLGSNVSGIRDILEPFSKYLFLEGDISELAKKINEIKTMPPIERAKLSRTMRKYIEQSFTIEKCISQYQNLYREMLKI